MSRITLSKAQILTEDTARQGHDRLAFTLISGLIVHAIIILGVTFEFNLGMLSPSQSSLDITLANYHQDTAPEDADYIAQYNQDGSGSLNEKARITSSEVAPLDSNQFHQQSQQSQASQAAKRSIISTNSNSQIQASISLQSNPENNQGDTRSQQNVTHTEIASLEAELDRINQLDSKRPRVERLNSLSTKARSDAAYLYAWEKRIEQIGNTYYPSRARDLGIFGDLRLMVALNADGSVRDIEILQSSGQNILDQAAINIVKKAAPFPKFSAEMQERADVIEIIRTWEFRKHFSTST